MTLGSQVHNISSQQLKKKKNGINSKLSNFAFLTRLIDLYEVGEDKAI